MWNSMQNLQLVISQTVTNFSVTFIEQEIVKCDSK